MNFWEAQRRARSNTKKYLFIFAVLTLGIAALIEWVLRNIDPHYQPPFPVWGFVFLLITCGVALFQYLMYRTYGGSYVATSAGGNLVERSTTNFQEQQLLNIVEEVAIASSLPVPPVYIIEANQINAFAAGINRKNAAIAITRGALNQLNREEIHGVIAHEFGHIYNGDMKISLQLAAMVMGFFFVIYIGLRMLNVAALQSRYGSQQKKGNPIAIIALLFFVAGAITWVFGSILKASVSREREYLADACAVQFTRNPSGIANALRKIGGMHINDMPASGMAYSHLYFDSHEGFSSLFATHPPLKKRIEAIEGKTYLPDEWKQGLN